MERTGNNMPENLTIQGVLCGVADGILAIVIKYRDTPALTESRDKEVEDLITQATNQLAEMIDEKVKVEITKVLGKLLLDMGVDKTNLAQIGLARKDN